MVPREGGKMVVRQLRMAGCAVDLASANADEAIHFKVPPRPSHRRAAAPPRRRAAAVRGALNVRRRSWRT